MFSALSGLGKPAAGPAAPAAPAAPAKPSFLSSLTSSIKGAVSSAGKAVTSAGKTVKGAATSASKAAAAAAAAAAQKAKATAASATADAVLGKGAGELLTKTGGTSGWTTALNDFSANAKAFGTGWFNSLFNFGDPSITALRRFLAYLPFIIIFASIFAYLAITRKWFVSKAAVAASTATTGATLNAKTANALIPATTTTPLSTALTPSGTAKKLAPGEYTLVSLQPRAIKQTGFVGPLPNGSFDSISAVSQALRSGFRFLTLQIDYLDTVLDTTKFPTPGIPTLIYRGDNGALLSTNSADIGSVAQMIASLAFRPEVPNYTEPLFIYLHIVRAPSPIRQTDKYIDFLSAIATALNPLAPTHLNTTPLGIFTRQKNEDTLINTSLNAFAGQTIVLCNADTTIFRNTTRQIAPANDLDYWTNIRVYLNTSDDIIGITQAPPSGVAPAAIVVYLADLLELSTDNTDQFMFKNKGKFIITMAPQLDNPDVEQLDTLLNTIGVNVVPLDIFSTDLKEVVSLVEEYSGMSFRPKSKVKVG
jgi:hypothetical protein